MDIDLLDQVREMQEQLGGRVQEIDASIAELKREKLEIRKFTRPLKTIRRAGRAGKPKRSEQFLALVVEKPGITVGQAAEELGVQSNYLYTLAAALTTEGAITKDGQGYHATGHGEEVAEEVEQAVTA